MEKSPKDVRDEEKKKAFRQVVLAWQKTAAEHESYTGVFALANLIVFTIQEKADTIRAWCEEFGFDANVILEI